MVLFLYTSYYWIGHHQHWVPRIRPTLILFLNAKPPGSTQWSLVSACIYWNATYTNTRALIAISPYCYRFKCNLYTGSCDRTTRFAVVLAPGKRQAPCETAQVERSALFFHVIGSQGLELWPLPIFVVGLEHSFSIVLCGRTWTQGMMSTVHVGRCTWIEEFGCSTRIYYPLTGLEFEKPA